MEQKVKPGSIMEKWREDKRKHGEKTGLIAGIGGGLMLVPPGSGLADGAQGGRQKATDESIRTYIENLRSPDLKTSVEASNALIKSKGRAVRRLCALLQDRHDPTFKRALFVLHNLDWGSVSRKKKAYALEKLTPVLFTFTKDRARSPSSLISQDIILRMGQDALPYLALLLKCRLPAARMIGLSALLEVYWPRMPYIGVAAIEGALDLMGNDPVSTFRLGARLVQKRIRAAYALGRNEVSGQWADEGGCDVRIVA